MQNNNLEALVVIQNQGLREAGSYVQAIYKLSQLSAAQSLHKHTKAD
jgi:hypothetical protein